MVLFGVGVLRMTVQNLVKITWIGRLAFVESWERLAGWNARSKYFGCKVNEANIKL
jgi:hypothetical protein